MNAAIIFYLLANKLIDACIDPTTLRVETYRDPHSFSEICRGFITRGATQTYFEFRVSDAERNIADLEQMVTDRAFYYLLDRFFPERIAWRVQMFDRYEAMLAPRVTTPPRPTRPIDTFEETGEE